MATIKDVAKLAGVSIATVSNVLNGKVSAESEKYRLVQEAVKELNYRPNYNAQNLKKGKTKLVGVLLPSLESPYCSIYQGICKVFEGDKYYPVLKLTNDNALLEQDLIHAFLNLGAAGIISVPAKSKPGEMHKEIEQRNLPFVAVERRLEDMDCNYVMFDNANLIRHQLKEFSGKWSNDELFLIHRKGYYTSDEDCRKEFLQSRAGKEENIIAASSDKDESFSKIFDQFVQSKGKIKCVITSTLPLAFVVYEVSKMLNQQVEIYALAEEVWNQHNYLDHIHMIKRDMLKAGMQAAEMLIAQEEHHGDTQTYYLKQKPEEKQIAAPAFTVRKELHVLAFEGEATDVLEKLSASAEAKFNIHMTFHKKSYEELKKALQEESKNHGCNYDILMIDKPWVPYYVNQDFLYELRKDLGREMLKRYPEYIRKSFGNYDKRRCVLPMISSIQVIYYRKDWFENQEMKAMFLGKYGVPLTPPKSWKEYNMISEFFTQEFNPNSPFVYGTVISTNDKNSLISEFYPRQWAFNGTLVDPWGDLVLKHDGNVRALNNLRETYRYCNHNSSHETKDDEMFYEILHGEVPMVMGFTSHYSPMKYKNQTCAHLLGITQVPRGKSILGGWCMGINNKSDHIKEACEYLRWMTSDEMSIANMRMNGCIPTYAVYHNTELQMRYPWLNLVNSTFANGGMRDKVISADGKQIFPEAIDGILGEMVLEALNTEKSTTDLLSETEDKLLNMIEQSIETF